MKLILSYYKPMGIALLLWWAMMACGLGAKALGQELGSAEQGEEETYTDSIPENRSQEEDPFRFDPGNQIRVFYPGMDRPDRIFSDTVFGPEFLQYDPARRNVDIGHLNGGYVGSAVFTSYFEYQRQMGFEAGHRAYDLYKLDLDTLPYYESDVAYSDVMYAQGGSQVETQTEANFGTTFQNQYISVNYRRINNTGVFNNQRAVHTALSLGYLYQTQKARLNIKFGSNVIQDRFNNGIQTDTLFGADLASIGSNIPVISQESQGRHQQRRYLVNYERQVSAGQFMDSWALELEYDQSYIKFFDENPDSMFYSPFYIDSRGLRQFIQWSTLEGRLQFSKKASEVFRYTAGFEFGRVALTQEPVRENIWQWRGYGHLDFILSKLLRLESKAEIGTQNNLPEYALDARLKAGDNRLSLEGVYASSSLVPDRVERQIYLRGTPLYEGSNGNIIHNQIGGTLALNQIGFRAELFFHNIDNFRYWRQGDLSPQVSNLSLLQFKAQYKWQWRSVVNNNVFAYQATDSDQLPVPEWQGRHSLFLDTRILNRTMHIRSGLEMRYYLNYTAPQFQAFYGTFFVVPDAPFDTSPYLLDYFFAFDVQSFHVLLRMENINTFFRPTRFYTLYRHPSNDFNFRIALRWRIPG